MMTAPHPLAILNASLPPAIFSSRLPRPESTNLYNTDDSATSTRSSQAVHTLPVPPIHNLPADDIQSTYLLNGHSLRLHVEPSRSLARASAKDAAADATVIKRMMC